MEGIRSENKLVLKTNLFFDVERGGDFGFRQRNNLLIPFKDILMALTLSDDFTVISPEAADFDWLQISRN